MANFDINLKPIAERRPMIPRPFPHPLRASSSRALLDYNSEAGRKSDLRPAMRLANWSKQGNWTSILTGQLKHRKLST